MNETELVPNSRGTRYALAIFVISTVSVVLTVPATWLGHQFGVWAARDSLGPGETLLWTDMAGPFSGWLTPAFWVWLVAFTLWLPRELIKAHRDPFYVQRNAKSDPA